MSKVVPRAHRAVKRPLRAQIVASLVLTVLAIFYLNRTSHGGVGHFSSLATTEPEPSESLLMEKFAKFGGRRLSKASRSSPSLHVPSSDSSSVLVPRGQVYFYTSSEAKRLGSFETWRPKEYVGQQQQRNKCQNPISGENNRAEPSIFVALVTASTQAWSTVPVQLLTMLQEIDTFGIYSDAADAIGGVEIVDVLADMHPPILEESPDFEAYRVLRAVRESHVNIGHEIGNVPGIHKLQRFLVLAALRRAYADDPGHDWYVLASDKTNVLYENLQAELAQYDPKKSLYLGSAVHGPDNLVFASLEAGIVVSHELARRALENMPDLVLHDAACEAHECRGDFLLAHYFRTELEVELGTALDTTQFEPRPLSGIRATAHNWCTRVLSLGNQSPQEMERLAEYTELKDRRVLYSDLYLDFIKPYISEFPEQNWDNTAQDLEFGPAHSLESDAHGSLSKCRDACSRIPQCLMLRYDHYTHYCGLGVSSVALGGPVIRYSTRTDDKMCSEFGVQCNARAHNEPMVSEWMIDRIRAMRESMSCDVLHYDTRAEGTEYGSLDQVEGWWHRATRSAT